MASDQIVSAKVILQAQLELQRVGTNKALAILESTEPDLAEFVLEVSTAQYHAILHTGASSKQARQIHDTTLTLVLTSLGALRRAHAALWQEGADDSPAPPSSSPPPETP